MKTYIDQLNYTSKCIILYINQVKTLYVLHQCRSKTSMEIKGADHNRHKYKINQTREHVEYIPSIALYFSNVRANQDKKLKIVANLLKMIGPMIMKLESLVLDAEKYDLNNVCLYYDSWETQIFNLLIRYFFYILL